MYNVASWPADEKLGGTTLRASAVCITTENGTSYELGKGKFRIVLTWTACDVDTTDEFYHPYIEANTRYATSTYYKIGSMGVYGAAAVTSDTVTPSAGSFEMIVDNPYDYQIRACCKVRGTPGTTGLTYSVVAYPLGRKA